MICVTPDGIAQNAAQQQLKKGVDPNDAQVLAHLEDAANAISETIRDQYMDMLQEQDDDNDDVTVLGVGKNMMPEPQPSMRAIPDVLSSCYGAAVSPRGDMVQNISFQHSSPRVISKPQ